MLSRIMLAISALLFATGFASAQTGLEILAKCDAPKGHAYFYPGALTAQRDAGWKADQISAGSFLLVQSRNGDTDIIFTDATRRTQTASSEGAEILPLRKDPGHYVVIVNYPNSILEVYMFVLDSSQRGTMTLSQTRHGGPIPILKHSVMAANCGG